MAQQAYRQLRRRTHASVAAFGTGRYESASRYLEPNKRINRLTALEITADLGFAELTSATGMSHYKDIGSRDQTDLLVTLEYSYEAFPTFSAFTRDLARENAFNQELYLALGEALRDYVRPHDQRIEALISGIRLALQVRDDRHRPGELARDAPQRRDDLQGGGGKDVLGNGLDRHRIGQDGGKHRLSCLRFRRDGRRTRRAGTRAGHGCPARATLPRRR